MSKEEYSEFWVFVNTLVDKWFIFLNEDVFERGVPLPY
jgi:hypothetical protein